MDARKGKLLLLVALVGLWAAILVFRQPSSPAPRPAPPRAAAGPARGAGAQGGGLPRLKTELLHLPPPAYTPEVQNIFGEPPPPPPPPRPQPAGATAAAAAAPPDPFLEEAKGLRYVGFLRRGAAVTAFIVQGQEVLTLAVGGTIHNRYRVQAIAEDGVTLSSLQGDRQVRLALTPEAARPPAR